jgi:hypothetical protein
MMIGGRDYVQSSFLWHRCCATSACVSFCQSQRRDGAPPPRLSRGVRSALFLVL